MRRPLIKLIPCCWQHLSERSSLKDRDRPRRSTRFGAFCCCPEYDAYLLSGYRDINLARVKKAEEYLFHCDELFVVANINRVVTNESVKEILRKKLGPHMTINENVCVICTHADVSCYCPWQLLAQSHWRSL